MNRTLSGFPAPYKGAAIPICETGGLLGAFTRMRCRALPPLDRDQGGLHGPCGNHGADVVRFSVFQLALMSRLRVPLTTPSNVPVSRSGPRSPPCAKATYKPGIKKPPPKTPQANRGKTVTTLQARCQPQCSPFANKEDAPVGPTHISQRCALPGYFLYDGAHHWYRIANKTICCPQYDTQSIRRPRSARPFVGICMRGLLRVGRNKKATALGDPENLERARALKGAACYKCQVFLLGFVATDILAQSTGFMTSIRNIFHLPGLPCDRK